MDDRSPIHLRRVTGQFADKPTRGQSSRDLVNSRTIVNSPKLWI